MRSIPASHLSRRSRSPASAGKPVDLQPPLDSASLLIHYGSPLITPQGTVVVPVKTGAGNAFRVEGHAARTGALHWFMNSDYSVPFAGFTPGFGPTLSQDRVVAPAAGGTVLNPAGR